jgi:hypothetical protein
MTEDAKLSKENALHLRKVERAYVSGGGAPTRDRQPITRSGVTKSAYLFKLCINNYGKTPGEILEYGVGWCNADEVDKLPARPQYKWFFYRDMVKPGIGSHGIKWLEIPEGISKAVIFGRLGYRDIFGECHSDGFIQEGGKPIIAPHYSYIASDPEWDLPEVGKRRYEKDPD